MTAFDTPICYEVCDGIVNVGLLASVMAALSSPVPHSILTDQYSEIIMSQIILTPNTNRLRQLCRDHGTVWWADPAGPRHMSYFRWTLGLNITSLDGEHNRNVPVDITEKVTNV